MSISTPNKPAKRVHLNQIKKCYIASGPARTTEEPSKEETEDLEEIEAEECQENENGTNKVLESEAIKPYVTKSGRKVIPNKRFQ